MISEKIKNRFIKDYKIPINILTEPYFSYFVELYDENYKINDKLELLYDTITHIGNETSFIEYYTALKERIFDRIKTSKAYENFINYDMSEFAFPQLNIKSKNIYIQENSYSIYGPRPFFASIDMKKANFQAMKFHDNNLVLDAKTYRDFAKKFTDLEYFINSKYIRQVIFGNMNPKRQITIQKYIMYQIFELLIEKGNFEKKHVESFMNDEIIIRLDSDELYNEFLSFKRYMINDVKESLGIDVDIKVFQIKQIEDRPFYVKEYRDNTFEFKCVPVVYMPQVYKKYLKLKPNILDKSFYYENQIATFNDYIF